MATTAATAADQVSYEDLYARWERGNWRAMELDFTVDKEHWAQRFDEFERKAALWNYSLFFHGEDSVTDNLSPFIDAAPREEQKYFLATQQVDEARHAVFFNRFMQEVVGIEGESIAETLERTRPELTWGFRKTFARLDKMGEELRKDRSLPKLAAGIALYHIVIEATLAQPGQHFIQSYLEERELLPGFSEGMRNVSLDEQRHIGFGVKMLADLIREDPECKDSVGELLREVSPYTTGVLVPPGWDRRYTECFGSTLEEIYEEGAISYQSKMRAVGLPLEDIPGLAFPHDLPPREIAETGIKLLRAGVLGEKNGPPARDPETMQLVFDSVRRAADPRRLPGQRLTVQWDFRDADPWHLRLDNGSSSVAPGAADSPDITFRCRYEDWVDLMAGREDPRKAMLTGKLRPRGNPRMLWKARNLFA